MKKRIDPQAETLHLEAVADLFTIKPNTLRQHVTRGTMPSPSVRRAPDLGWDAAALYLWAHSKGLISLDAVPFRHWGYILAHAGLSGPQVPRMLTVSSMAHRSDSGLHVRYGDLTTEGLGFTLYYPDHYGRATPNTDVADVVVQVTDQASNRGFFVDVHQTHPDYDYDVDSDIHTRDVAELTLTSLPYWAATLRTAFRGIDRRTGQIIVAECATAQPHDVGSRGLSATVEAFAQNYPGHSDLIAALHARIAQTYRHAASEAQHDLDTYVTPHHANQGTLTDTGHLFPAATPQLIPEETVEEEFARTRLADLFWDTPVGDTPIARALAEQFSLHRDEHDFPLTGETTAQAAFRTSLTPVPPERATLVHLGLCHSIFAPRRGTAPRTYWADPTSGAVAVLYQQDPDTPERFAYTLPPKTELPVDIDSFDFEDDRQPFLWTADGAAIPFPAHPDYGYSLGHEGRGPYAVKETAARLLGLDPDSEVSERWPFYHPGYPARVSAEAMRNHYKQPKA